MSQVPRNGLLLIDSCANYKNKIYCNDDIIIKSYLGEEDEKI